MAEADSASRTARSVVRTVVVIVVATWSLLSAFPDVALPWHPFSSFGFWSDGDGNITEVFPGYSAAQAGLRIGDRIDLKATPFESRRYIGTSYSAAWEPGMTSTFVVDSDVRAVRSRSPRNCSPDRSPTMSAMWR